MMILKAKQHNVILLVFHVAAQGQTTGGGKLTCRASYEQLEQVW